MRYFVSNILKKLNLAGLMHGPLLSELIASNNNTQHGKLRKPLLSDLSTHGTVIRFTSYNLALLQNVNEV